MKSLLLSLGLLVSASIASANATQGACEGRAVERALQSAPGIDESSEASLTAIRLVKTVVDPDGRVVEKYYVQTEDQGGSAASILTLKVWSRTEGRVLCQLLAQRWVD